MTDNKVIPLSGAEIDTLVALVERGPLEPGELPSKGGCHGLLLRGYAVQTAVQGEEGYYAVAQPGIEAYKREFSTSMAGYGGETSLAEVKANRIAKADIRRAIYGSTNKKDQA